jgi:hypothetical protein
VVLAPDILLGAMYDAEARAILHQWRDGNIVPVVTRDLLLLYLKTLRQAGLGADLVRKWSLWLTAAEKTIYLTEAGPSVSTGLPLCREVAEANDAELITQSRQSA